MRRKFFYADTHQQQPATDLPSEATNKIICGDSSDVLKTLPDNCVDLVFTSPPYNFGMEYAGDGGGDAIDWGAYFEKLLSILDECVRVLTYGGRLVVNVQPLFSDYIPTHHIISQHLMRRNLIWRGEILWEKNNYNCKYTAWGSWKSPSSPYLKYTWEFLEVFCKGELTKKSRGGGADIAGDDFKKWVYAKWSIAPERGMKKYQHPAMFPYELARRVLQMFSFQDEVVLDPFVGMGTTCLVARDTGRRYLGIDISPEYCHTAEQRVSEGLL